jgi:hypothetical protein
MASRKFIFAIVAWLLGFILVCFCIFSKKVESDIIKHIVTMLGSIVLFYMGGNVGEKFIVSRGKKNEPQG